MNIANPIMARERMRRHRAPTEGGSIPNLGKSLTCLLYTDKEERGR